VPKTPKPSRLNHAADMAESDIPAGASASESFFMPLVLHL